MDRRRQKIEMKELAGILHLVRDKKHYPLSYPSVEHEKNQEYVRLVVETRSVMGILFLLSQSVEVPAQHIQDGKVIITRDDTGQPFDWNLIVGKLFCIQSHAEIEYVANAKVIMG